MCRLTALDGLLTGTVIGASEDQMFTISNMKKARGESSTVGEGGLEWAAWVQFLGPTEEVKHYHFLKTLLEVFAKNLEAECRVGSFGCLLTRCQCTLINAYAYISSWCPTMFYLSSINPRSLILIQYPSGLLGYTHAVHLCLEVVMTYMWRYGPRLVTLVKGTK